MQWGRYRTRRQRNVIGFPFSSLGRPKTRFVGRTKRGFNHRENKHFPWRFKCAALAVIGKDISSNGFSLSAGPATLGLTPDVTFCPAPNVTYNGSTVTSDQLLATGGNNREDQLVTFKAVKEVEFEVQVHKSFFSFAF